MALFNIGNFELHSGKESNFKIDCDALTDEDWESLAALASLILPRFNKVHGIPTGGEKFAKALAKYSHPLSKTLLIVDDVLTTGQSMEEAYTQFAEAGVDNNILGVVVFNRRQGNFRSSGWITSLFKTPDDVIMP